MNAAAAVVMMGWFGDAVGVCVLGGGYTHCDRDAAGNRWVWCSDSSSVSSAKLAFLRRGSRACTSRRPGDLLAVCTHTCTEPSVLSLTTSTRALLAKPAFFLIISLTLNGFVFVLTWALWMMLIRHCYDTFKYQIFRSEQRSTTDLNEKWLKGN